MHGTSSVSALARHVQHSDDPNERGLDVATPATKTTTERTPLLASDRRDNSSAHGECARDDGPTTATDHASDTSDKPFPKLQLALLCYARLIDPIAFFSIFPYINKMAQSAGHLADADVGFYSGLIESLFSLTQMAVMVAWAHAADRLGRKPVLVVALFGLSLAVTLFGFARSIAAMVVFRCVAGLFAGTLVTVRTMISELSTPRTAAKAFSWFALSANLGLFLGPLIGGALAEPAEQYPDVFGGIGWLEDYPYALPGLAVGLVGLSGCLVCLFGVKETMPADFRQKKKPKGRGRVEADDDNDNDHNTSSGEMSSWRLVHAPGVTTVLCVYMHLMLLTFALNALAPIVWFTPVSMGGYGFSPLQISLTMALSGLAQILWILVLFPPLQARIGNKGVLRACTAAYPFYFLFFPVPALLLRHGGDAARTAFWVVFPTGLTLLSGVSMAFTAVQLALNEAAPSPQTLGTLNALALAGTSGLRSFVPAVFTSLFAIGVHTQFLWGYAIWLLMAAVAAGLAVAVKHLPEDKVKREERH